ncbi:MAG: hypothetical protein ACQEQV_07860 [Fibrobacterota bacterium]
MRRKMSCFFFTAGRANVPMGRELLRFGVGKVGRLVVSMSTCTGQKVFWILLQMQGKIRGSAKLLSPRKLF